MSQKMPEEGIKNFETVNDMLLVNFTNGEEGIVSFSALRDNCPCASCAGEKDVFGNIYKGPAQLKTDASYRLRSIESVGYYGIRPQWEDGHNTGIFTAKFLMALVEK